MLGWEECSQLVWEECLLQLGWEESLLQLGWEECLLQLLLHGQTHTQQASTSEAQSCSSVKTFHIWVMLMSILHLC